MDYQEIAQRRHLLGELMFPLEGSLPFRVYLLDLSRGCRHRLFGGIWLRHQSVEQAVSPARRRSAFSVHSPHGRQPFLDHHVFVTKANSVWFVLRDLAAAGRRGKLRAVDPFYVSPELLRIAEAAVFASREPLTWQSLAPLLPRDLDPGVVFTALEKHCAGRGVILVKVGEGWTFRTAPDLGPKLRQMMTETRRLPRAVMETLVLIALHQPVSIFFPGFILPFTASAIALLLSQHRA